MTTERLARPTTNHYATDPDAAATRRQILRVLAVLPRYETLDGRTIAQRLYGTDFVGRSRAASAIGWLLNERYIERGGQGTAKRYRITDLGRERLAQAQPFAVEEPAVDLPPCSEES